ncbi:MAG: hypothetical protein ACXV97_11575 [Chthoniobacterales bacterium]
MPNFGYHLARAEGAAVRRIYAANLPALVRRKIRIRDAELPFEVYSYSGETTLPEQVASIRSFLRYAGRPMKWTIASDGTHTARSITLLKSISPLLTVALPNEWLPPDIPAKLISYLRDHATGKQLALIMSLPAREPVLYLDSDVLFFAGACELVNCISSPSYLADCQLSADERLFHSADEKANPVNTGVLFLPRKLDWSLGMQRLRELDGAPHFFTNQTITHLVMHANAVQPFDAKRFVLQLDDQFVYPDQYARPEIVLRHYVQPLRHKFWNRVWR